eukprot:5550611-Amphidinium_carterae.1
MCMWEQLMRQLLCALPEAVSMQTVDASSEDVIRERLELDVKNVEDIPSPKLHSVSLLSHVPTL